LNLQGESILGGFAEGIVLGGCMNLIETSLGTPWALDTTGCILLLEDRGMKPWQIDRTLMHLMQAGKFRGVVASCSAIFRTVTRRRGKPNGKRSL